MGKDKAKPGKAGKAEDKGGGCGSTRHSRMCHSAKHAMAGRNREQQRGTLLCAGLQQETRRRSPLRMLR